MSSSVAIPLDDARHDLDFDYDALGRLTDFTAAGSAPLPASQVFTYDGNGNRESITENSTPYTYSITTNTNRLASTAGPTAKSFTYDAAGNVTSDNIHSYAYDDRGRLVTVDSGAVTYQHNGQGQRVKKDDGSAVTLFAYDEVGQLIGEYDDTGAPIRETVYFAEVPVAILMGSNAFYVHTDHLGTPRIVTDGNTIIWRWESDPFGATAAQEDPDGDLTAFTYSRRFPGQHYDAESGLHYNYFRDYDPSVGRYVESDPLGLEAGINSYAYVNQNPLRFSDPTGQIIPYVIIGGRVAYGGYRAYRAYRAAQAASAAVAAATIYNNQTNQNGRAEDDSDSVPPQFSEICPFVGQRGGLCLYLCTDGTYTNMESIPESPEVCDAPCPGAISRLQGVKLGGRDWWRGVHGFNE